MSDDNKVIPLFPGKPNAIELFSDATNIEVEELSDEDIEALAEIQEDGELAGIASMLTASVSNQLASAGYDINDAPQDFCFAMEALLSMLMRFRGRDHTLQTMADNLIYIENEEMLIYQFIQPKITLKDNNADS